MKKKFVIIFITLPLFSSCSKKDLIAEKETLAQAIGILIREAENSYRKAEASIIRKGNPNAAVKLQFELKEINDLKKKYHLNFAFEDEVNRETLSAYLDEYYQLAEKFLEHDASGKEGSLILNIKNTARDFFEDPTQKNYMVFLLSKSILDSRLASLFAELVGPYNRFDLIRAHLYSDSDTMKIGVPFNAIISLEEPLNYDYINIDPPQLLITIGEDKVVDYTIETYGKGAWKIGFKPLKAGKCRLEFQSAAHSTLYSGSIGYNIFLRKDLVALDQ